MHQDLAQIIKMLNMMGNDHVDFERILMSERMKSHRDISENVEYWQGKNYDLCLTLKTVLIHQLSIKDLHSLVVVCYMNNFVH